MIKCNLKTILKKRNLKQNELCILINARPSTICDHKALIMHRLILR